MAKKKETQKIETSQIEEVDLSAIDIDSLSLSNLVIETPKKSEKISKKSSKKSEETSSFFESKNPQKSEEEEIAEFMKKNNLDEDFDIEIKDTKDFDDDFNDDFGFDPDEGELAEIEKDFDPKMPKDFFTDKRRQKTLKKFLDVEVPAEYLEGLDEKMQLLFKKGKVEGKLVYDEVMTALPPGDDIEFMDEVFSRLAKLGIELVDSLDQSNLFQGGEKKEEIDLADISDDSIRMYLNEIGRFALINADEETRLGRLVQK